MIIFDEFIIVKRKRSYLVSEICSEESFIIPNEQISELEIDEEPEMLAVMLALLNKVRYDAGKIVDGRRVSIEKNITKQPEFKENLLRLLDSYTIENLIFQICNNKYEQVWKLFFEHDDDV